MAEDRPSVVALSEVREVEPSVPVWGCGGIWPHFLLNSLLNPWEHEVHKLCRNVFR